MNTVKIFSLILLSLSLLLPISAPSADANQAYKLYQQVMSGQKKMKDLTQQQQRQVITIHSILNRSSCDGCTQECRDAKEEAEGYRDDLESYTKRLSQCVEGNDLTDDCYSEFRRVKSSHSDFESAVSDVGSYCN